MFTSSLDADAAGVEGSSYVWTPGQLHEVLGDDDGDWAAGFRRHRHRYLRSTAPRCCSCRPTPRTGSGSTAFGPLYWRRGRASAAGSRRLKVVTAWNGLAITALAEASVALDDPRLLMPPAAARKFSSAASCRRAIAPGDLGGTVGESAAILEDYAMLSTGLLSLYQLTGEQHRLKHATVLLDLALRH